MVKMLKLLTLAATCDIAQLQERSMQLQNKKFKGLSRSYRDPNFGMYRSSGSIASSSSGNKVLSLLRSKENHLGKVKNILPQEIQ